MKMKRSAWLYGWLMLGLFFWIPATGSAATLNLSNGGFENGFAHWTQKYAAGEINSFHSQGSSSLKLLNGGAAQAGYESDKLEARPGVLYTVKAKSYVTSGSGLLIIQFFDGAGSRIYQESTVNGTIGSGGVWTPMSVSELAPAGAEYVNVMLYTNSGTVYFDEVSVEADTQVVTGTVVLAESSPTSPIEGADVNLYTMTDTLYQTPLGGATTDSSGEFLLYADQPLPSGTYVLRAVKNEHAESVDIPIDATGKSGVTIRLRPDADTYFTESPGWFRNYVPGVINPNEGTVELKVEIDRPYEELGNEYDFMFQMAPRKSVGNTLLSMYTPVVDAPNPVTAINNPSQTPLESLGLSALLRNQQTGSPSVRLSAADTGFKGRYNVANSRTHMLAMTWAQDEPLRLYVDGVAVASSGSDELNHPISPELLPYHFQISTLSPFKTKEVRISTKAIGAASLHSTPNTALQKTADTSLISNDMATVQRFKTSNMSGYSAVMPADRPERKSFVDDERVVVPFVSVNYAAADRTYHITIRADDEKGADVASIVNYPVSVPADGRQRIHEIPFPAIGEPGYYSLDIAVTEVSSNTSVTYASAVAVLPKNDATIADGALQSYYGQHYTNEMDPSVMLDMGVKATRAWGGRAQAFAWHSLEPQNDQWRWDAADRYVDYSSYAGMDIVGVLGNPPRWAAQRPIFRDGNATNADKVKVTEYSVLPQRWVPTSTSDNAEWREYIRETALRYKEDVKYWEIYNEVNFHYVQDAATTFMPEAFAGTSTQYFELLKAAYEEVQEINEDEQALNPNFVPIKVLTSGFSAAFGAADQQMPVALLASTAYKDKFDIFNVHGYTGASAWSALTVPQGTPKWMTEQAWLTDTVQSRRMFRTVESFFDFLGNGYQRFYHFGLSTFIFDRYTLSPQPDYYVAAVFQNRMRKANSYEGDLDFVGSEAFSIRHVMLRSDNKYLTVIGSRNGGYDLKLNNPSSQIESVTDLYGRTVTQSASQPLTYNTGINNLLYVISTHPLDIQDNPELTLVGELVHNGDFQDIGDPFAGLSHAKPNGWTYNNSPSNGSFTVVEPNAGDYAIQVAKNSTGNLFISQDVIIPKPGYYQLTVKFRRVGLGTSFTAWAFFKDRDSNGTPPAVTQSGASLSSEDYTTLTVPLSYFSAPVNNAVIGFGILGSGAGTVIIDDVKLEYLGT